MAYKDYKYLATKNGVTKGIYKGTEDFYRDNGWTITINGNYEGDIDPYDIEEVKNAGLEFLQPIIINGYSFEGYSTFTCINTKTYVAEPERTLDGSIPNINDYETFIVPRVKVSFAYMTLEDYRRFLNAISEYNEFDVSYYDYEIGEKVTHKMYIEPREMQELYNKGYQLLGMLNTEISLIGTLND